MHKVSRIPRLCVDCPVMYLPTSNRQKRCQDCSAVAKRGTAAFGRQCADCPARFTAANGRHRWCPPCGAKRDQEYRRAWADRNSKPLTRPCRNLTCDNQVPRNGKVYAWFCSDDCKPRCVAEECDEPQRKGKLCGNHYQRKRAYGDPNAPVKFEWSRADKCINCGEATGAVPGLKKYCSWACANRWNTYKGNPPTEVWCVHCGISLSLELVEGRTRRRRRDTAMCRRCRQDLRKYGVTAGQLANRDGNDCSLCGTPVDMGLRAPDPGCPSIDHRWPCARGGTNDPDNLFLAHLGCNMEKHAKIPT